MVKRLVRPMILRVLRQTGVRRSLKIDKKRRALLPSKRRSRTGKVYWETRRNRSDVKGKRI